MLAGMLFAVREAEDRTGVLAATLPFAGVTLIEFQSRLLIAAGVTQVVVISPRPTPELGGAIARIARRGITVDTARNATEAAARLHPLARIMLLADGLVTTDAILAPFAQEGGDALLVTDSTAATEEERIGAGLAWGGVARLQAQRLEDIVRMPHDYDVELTLVHAARQAQAAHLPLPADDRAHGHGIERRGAALEARSRAIVMATLAIRSTWFDRWIVRPLSGVALPVLLRHGGTTALVAVGAGVAAAGGLAVIARGHVTVGVLLAITAALAAALGERLAWLRDERVAWGLLSAGIAVVPAIVAIVLGLTLDRATPTGAGLPLALALVVFAALAIRGGARLAPGTWWPTPPAYLPVVALGAAAGAPLAGVALATIYAAATLATVIERLRATHLAHVDRGTDS